MKEGEGRRGGGGSCISASMNKPETTETLTYHNFPFNYVVNARGSLKKIKEKGLSKK